MKTLEQLAIKAVGDEEELRSFVTKGISDDLIAFLCALENPLLPRHNSENPPVADGRREVIALLYRYGAKNQNTIENHAKTTKETGAETESGD